MTISNHGATPRDIALTSYAELVLGSAAADAAHPAFSKMFVQTESVEDGRILLATRRRRSPGEPKSGPRTSPSLKGRALAPSSSKPTARAFSDAAGRCAMRWRCRMKGRCPIRSAPSSIRSSACAVAYASNRVRPRGWHSGRRWPARAKRCSRFASRCSCRVPGRRLTGAAAHAAADRARFAIDAAQAEQCARLLSPLLYAEAAWRSTPAVLERARGGPPVLWTCGISGDRPIVLLRIASQSGLDRVHELLRMQLYWQAQRLGVDVVLLNCATGNAGDNLHAALEAVLDGYRTRLLTGVGRHACRRIRAS